VGAKRVLEGSAPAFGLFLREGLGDHRDACFRDAFAFEDLASGAARLEVEAAHGAEQFDEAVGPADLEVRPERQQRIGADPACRELEVVDRKSTRLNSSHVKNSYAV